MKVAELRLTETKFAARYPPTFDHSLFTQMTQVFRRTFAESDVAYSRLQVAPSMINVHFVS